jgi:hypothetical protein
LSTGKFGLDSGAGKGVAAAVHPQGFGAFENGGGWSDDISSGWKNVVINNNFMPESSLSSDVVLGKVRTKPIQYQYRFRWSSSCLSTGRFVAGSFPAGFQRVQKPTNRFL